MDDGTHDDLDARQVLAASEGAVRARRSAEIQDLLLALRWADLHAWDPRRAPEPRHPGGSGPNTLVEVGGEGTPWVQDLCLPELAIARRTHVLSTRAVVADALDLRHRLPLTWRVVLEGDCESWLARRVASLSRRLSVDRVGVVDRAVARALAGEQPSRVLAIAEAKVIEADPAAHAARVEEQLRRRGVWLSRSDDSGIRSVIARVDAGDAAWVDAVVARVADLLRRRPDLRATWHPDLPERPTGDELRGVAFGWLAHPAELADLLASQATPDAPGDPEDPGPRPSRRSRTTRAVVHVHLDRASLDAAVDGGADAVARVEGVGPMLRDQLRRFLAHSQVTLAPVIDLEESVSVNAYEHPTPVRRRVRLRSPGDVFPHGSSLGALDLDHPTPYDPHGPPGQTGDHQAAPLSRTGHRAKTFLGYRLEQIGPSEYVWRTPHGLHRHVGPTGTHDLTEHEAAELVGDATLDDALRRIEETLASRQDT